MFCVRRLVVALLLIVSVASGAFLLTRVAAANSLQHDPIQTREELHRLRDRLGLNQPLLAHYAAWLRGVVRLDFGESIIHSRPVITLMRERAVNTAILASSALALATLIGLPLGIYTARQRTGLGPALARLVSTLLLSTPPLIGSLLLLLLATRTGWMPAGGMTSGEGPVSGWRWLAEVILHLPVPALALALPLAATLERLQSQALAEVLREPFVRATLARGISEPAAIARHAWPVSLGPILGLYGVMIGSLFSGSFIVELVTSWPGLGRLMVDGLQARDLYLVSGGAAAGAACLAAGTFLTDVVHAAIDPRVREGG
jgi:peptide/nickel transport system permease protein